MAFAPLDPKIRAAVEERLRGGDKTPAICADLPVSPATVRRIALALRLERRPGRPPARTADQAREMHGRGMSIREIAYELRREESTVAKYVSDGKRKKERVV